MVEVHADGDVRIDFRDGVHHVLQHDVVGVGPRATRGLDDDGRIDRRRRVHDRQPLLHVIDVERRDAVAVLGCVIQQLPQCNARHRCLPVLS